MREQILTKGISLKLGSASSYGEILILQENPTTGYTWILERGPDSCEQLVKIETRFAYMDSEHNDPWLAEI